MHITRWPGWKCAGIVIGVGVLVRLALLVAYEPHIGADGRHYQELALSLLQDGSLGGMGQRPPIYPLLVAGIWSLTGAHNLIAVVIVQNITGLLTALLWFVSVWMLTQSPLAATLAGVVSSLDIPLTAMELFLYTEPLSAFLVALTTASFIWYITSDGTSLRRLWICGLAIGLLAMTRVLFMLYMAVPLGVLLVVWIIQRRGWLSYLAAAVSLTLPTVVLMSMLVAYNWRMFHFAGPTTLSGYNLTNKVCSVFHKAPDEYSTIRQIYLTHRARRYEEFGTCDMTIWTATPDMLEQTGLSFAELSQQLSTISLYLIRTNAPTYFKLVMKSSLFTLFEVMVYDLRMRVMLAGFQAIHYGIAVLFLASVGFIVGRWRSVPQTMWVRTAAGLLFALATLVYVVAISSLMESGENGRYRLPVDMAMYVVPIVAWWLPCCSDTTSGQKINHR